MRVSSCKSECAKVNTNASESGSPAAARPGSRKSSKWKIEDSPRPLLRGRSSPEDRPILQQRPKRITVRRRHGSTHRQKLREADGISCSRISINQVTITMRLKRLKPSQPAAMTSCTESARQKCQNRKNIPRRGGTRRAAPLSLFTTNRERAGTPRLHGGILSIARSTARAFPPSDFYRGKGWAGKRTKERRSFLRHDVALHHPVSLEIATKLLATNHLRSQLVFFPCNFSIQHTSSDILRTFLRCLENI